MGRRSKRHRLCLWMNGLYVGVWQIDSRGEHELAYDPAWIDSELGRPVSLSMPLRPAQAPYRGEVVRNFFENLLPDSRAIRERLQAKFNTASTSAAHLLAEIGRDCAGALMLLPEHEEPVGYDRIDAEPLTEDRVEKILHAVTLSGRHGDDEDFRISIAGAQEKTALLWHDGQWCRPRGATPTTHILKLPLGVPPSGIDLTTSIENEWLCARILHAYRVPVALGEIERFGRKKVLVVPRFDRQLASDHSWYLRLPQEDFAQAAGAGPDQKYESDGGPGIREINQRLLGSVRPLEDRIDFFRTQVLFWMLAAIDGHAKNFSVFIEPRGKFRLAPRYDVLSAYPVMGHGAGKLAAEKIKMAMAVWDKHRHYHWLRVRRHHFERTATDCGLGNLSPEIIDGLVQETPRVIEQVHAALPARFAKSVSIPIFSGLQAAADRLR